MKPLTLADTKLDAPPLGSVIELEDSVKVVFADGPGRKMCDVGDTVCHFDGTPTCGTVRCSGGTYILYDRYLEHKLLGEIE